MTKVVSAGVLVKIGDRYLLGHATGCEHFDMFKGRMDEGETYIQTAIRECFEESGLRFSEDALTDLGIHIYTRKKDLAIYMARLSDVSMNDLKCTTYLENGKPEMDFYATMDWNEMISKVGKSMGILFSSLEDSIKNY